jgi:hypothetical protein
VDGVCGEVWTIHRPVLCGCLCPCVRVCCEVRHLATSEVGRLLLTAAFGSNLRLCADLWCVDVHWVVRVSSIHDPTNHDTGRSSVRMGLLHDENARTRVINRGAASRHRGCGSHARGCRCTDMQHIAQSAFCVWAWHQSEGRD